MDRQHTHRPSLFKAQVELLHHKVGEVIGGNGEKQLVPVECSGRVHQHHPVGCVRLCRERTGRIGSRKHTVFPQAEAQVPAHSLDTALDHHAATEDTFQHLARQLRHIGGRIFLNQCFQGVLETFGIPGLHISQRFEEHELRHQVCQRVFGADIAVVATDGDGVFRQIARIGRLVDRILHLVHHPDIIFIVRIGNRNRIIRFRESRDQLILIGGSQRCVAGTKRHQVDLVVAFSSGYASGNGVPVLQRLRWPAGCLRACLYRSWPCYRGRLL